MPTAQELGLRPGDRFIHSNKAGAFIECVTHYLERDGSVVAWVERASFGGPIEETFPDRTVNIPPTDNGLSRPPRPENLQSS